VNILRNFLGWASALVVLVCLLPVVVGIIAFKSVAFLTKRLAGLLEPRFLTWPELIEFYPAIGWRSKPNLNTYALVDDLFRITTDADGWRVNTTRLVDSDLIVFGDSHAFGYGIDEKDFFANVDPEVRVKSVGVISYNMVQELLLMRELSRSLNNKLVVWFVFLGNDLLDNLEPSQFQYRTPFVRETDGPCQWEIVTSHVSPKPWPFVSRRYLEVNYDRLSKIYSPGFVADRAFAACEYLIVQGARICEGAGARLAIVTIPDPMPMSQEGLDVLSAHGADPKLFDPELPDKRIRAMCERLDLRFVAGKDFLELSDYKEFDDHWNKRGHRRIAGVLRCLQEERGLSRKAELYGSGKVATPVVESEPRRSSVSPVSGVA
jgi:hypothetical protein